VNTDRAAAYDAWYATPLGSAAHAIELRLVAQLAAPQAGERSLDAGCGTGIYIAWLSGLGLEVTGLDRDRDMLEAAAARAPQATLVEGDVTSLPFRDGEFDLALAVTVFCFLDDAARTAAARELVRVTRPGGRIVVGELARYSLWAAQRRVKGWLGSATWRAVQFTTAGELRRLFLAAGAVSATARYGLYLPPVSRIAATIRTEACERLARPLGPLGAAFVVVRADR
jgi:ubiquinone/menaquinone biosynthesis C-methylase UbiE